MRTSKIISAIALVSSVLIVPSFEVRRPWAASAARIEGTDPDEGVDGDDDDDEEGPPTTCSLDPPPAGVARPAAADADVDGAPPPPPPPDCRASSRDDATADRRRRRRGRRPTDGDGLAGRVVPLTDDNFDDLTASSTSRRPATWLVVFKTDSCGICRKVAPVLEALAVDGDVVGHNERELLAAARGEGAGPSADGGGGGGTPPGPIYIGMIDAGWSGADTAKRFGVDATPTILVLRSEGRGAGGSDVDPPGRSYYVVYREQRALHPMRKFVLGGYELRRRIDVPPPLPDAERRPRGRAGRLYGRYLSPGARWAGGVMGKILLAWFAFMGILGLSMRVHNYAWGGDDGDDDADRRERREREIESERARGREGHEPSMDEKTANRQRMMWERKEANQARFAARREARKAKGDAGDEDDDDEMKRVGVSVKKSDARRVTNDFKKEKKT
jgi:hypothetical protein